MQTWRLKGQLNGYLAATDFVVAPGFGLAVVAGWDGAVRVYDTATMAEATVLEGHDGYVTDARFTSDGKKVLTASTSIEVRPGTPEDPMDRRDGSVRVWDLASQDEIFYLRPRRLWQVMLSDDGRYLAAMVRRSDVNTIEIWDVDEWCKLPLPPALEEQKPVKHEGCCTILPVLLAISSDARLFATVMFDEVSFWDTRSRSLIWAFATGDATQLDVRIGGPEPFAVLAGLRHPPCRLDLHEQRVRWRMEDEFVGAEALCLSFDARRLVVRLPSREIAVICADTGSCIFRRTTPSGGYYASWSAGVLATDYKGDGAELVDGTTGEHLATLSPSPPPPAIPWEGGKMYRFGQSVALAMGEGILLTGLNYTCVWERVS